MKKIASILVLLLFTNFTVSPLFFSSPFFGKVTEERAESGNQSTTLEEELVHKSFCPFDTRYSLYSNNENIVFGYSEANPLSVFIELSIQPPEQLV